MYIKLISICRLPQDIFQTAKIAKLLLMMERGLGSENHGKTLKEIDIQLESWNQQSSGKDETGNDFLLHSILAGYKSIIYTKFSIFPANSNWM